MYSKEAWLVILNPLDEKGVIEVVFAYKPIKSDILFYLNSINRLDAASKLEIYCIPQLIMDETSKQINWYNNGSFDGSCFIRKYRLIS